MRKHNVLPEMRRHRARGQAYVNLNRRDVYLGVYGTPAAHAEYDRIIAEWLANGRRLPDDDLTIAELALRYQEFAESYYARSSTGEIPGIKTAMQDLTRLFGRLLVGAFGPLKLKTVRQQWIDSGRVRLQINKSVQCVVRFFRWAVENELASGEQLHSLRAVAGLRARRLEAKESNPVEPVADTDVDAVLP